MVDVYYDLHIHTALSPCGHEDMTPNNIVNMCLLNGLDVIAITDHNTCGNAGAVMEVAKDTDLLVIPGMEVETAEEVHVVCLFATLPQAEAFEEQLAKTRPKVPNKPGIFGTQLYLDAEDNVTGECQQLLLMANGMGLYALVPMVAAFGGVAIPAHIDRPSNSIMSNLGSMPPDLGVSVVEFSRYSDPKTYLEANKRLFSKEYPYISSSDAHDLGTIAERIHCLCFEQKPTAEAVIDKLRTL